ncbi:MAG: hypothetical protein WDO19_00785 [Bacteroidota bacterium]
MKTIKTLLSQYDIVTLLIGVNNQYQGVPIETYGPGFEELLKKIYRFCRE